MPTYLTAPDGSRWAVVPVKATEDMVEDGGDTAVEHSWGSEGEFITDESASYVYAAMLAAAPEFPISTEMTARLAMAIESGDGWSFQGSSEACARAVLAALFSEVKP